MTTIAPPPPPPAPARPPLSPGARTATRALIVVVAAVLVVGTVVSLGVAAFGVSSLRVVADSKDLPNDIRSLVIDTGDLPAAVRITTDPDATAPRAELRLLKSERVGEHALTVAMDGPSARMTVSGGESPFLRWGRAGELTVTLPPAVARRLSVTTRQQDGVLIAQADVDELISRGRDGAVLLSGGARRIEVHNDRGSVIASSPLVVVESFTVDTTDGDIAVDFEDAAPRTVEATSRTGDVTLGLPGPGPFEVRAVGADSSVTVPVTSDPKQATSDVTARSDYGSVVVSGPGADPFRGHR